MHVVIHHLIRKCFLPWHCSRAQSICISYQEIFFICRCVEVIINNVIIFFFLFLKLLLALALALAFALDLALALALALL